MLRKKILRTCVFHLGLSLLILNVLSIYYPQLSLKIREVKANPYISSEWFYDGWQYRKEHNITYSLSGVIRFYNISDRWTTISENPTNRHTFQPVHNTTIIEVNKVIDGATRKYLAYDSDAEGSQIRLYYTNDVASSWTAYSGNPILGPQTKRYGWPSVAYVNNTFHMFLTNRGSSTLERWISTNGVSYTFVENVKIGGNEWNNPFIWFNPNDNKCYLYTHDISGGIEYFKVRSTTNIENLDEASDTIILSRTIPFGSPTVMYFDDKYWLLGEIYEGGVWKVVAYYSATSPYSGFIECKNSPILSNDEACPMLLLNLNQTRAYLFITRDKSRWYQDTREVYLNSTILPETPNLINYQVKITAYYGNGTDGGENVYLNGHSRTDFGDVRFTWLNYSSGSEIECDYWIEKLIAGDRAVFWVEIPEISSGVNDTMYIYYGKSDATTTSNGDDTFDFFDDFSGTLSKWTVISGTWQIENGELSGETNVYGQRIRANNFYFGNHSVHVKIKWISGTYFEHGPYVRGQPPNEQNNGYMTILSTWASDARHRISRMSSASETTIVGQGTTNPSRNVWYNCTFKLYESTFKSSFSPLYSTEISGTDNTFKSGTLCLYSWSASSEHAHYDDLFVRKYVEPEPSHGGWGSEEKGEYVILDQTFVSDGRTDVGSIQTIGFHAKWNNNGSDVVGGNIYVNGTKYVTNNTGWINVRAAARREEPDNFTIIALPDTQFYSESYPAIFDNQTQWVVNNAQSMNIVFVTHEGDIVNDYSSLSQWNNANNSMSKLDAGNVSYGVLPGNHDGSPLNLSNFNKFFNYSRFNGKSWYGGAYQNENTNNFELFHGGQDDYLIFHFQYDPSDQVLTWANNTLQNYPNRRVIVTTHSYLNVDGTRTDIGNRIWQNFVASHADQIFLVLCGHNHAETQRTDIINGHTVYQIMANYQDRTNGGNGWLRILEFHPVEDKIYMRTYSPYLNNYETDADSQFTIDYDMTWAASSIVEKVEWIVTGVNCSGITTYTQTAQIPSIIWDRIKIIDGGITKGSVMLGETVTIWFKALYEYDNDIFDGTNGVLYVNGSDMSWSTTNNRWEYYYTPTTLGPKAFIISGVSDTSYSLTVINDTMGAQTINVWSSPFLVISNSTISELVFNSTSRILSFTVSGPSGTIGYTNVTIAKTLIEDINELKVYLDENQINYTATSTDYSWMIHFTYQHSTHKVVIILGTLHAESVIKTPLETATIFNWIVIAILAATLLVSITARKKLARAKRNFDG